MMMKKLKPVVLAAVCLGALSMTPAQAASKGKVLLVASSTDTLDLKDGRKDPTGYFLDELAGLTMRLI